MTNAYMRVNRDGEWTNVEIDRLTDAELEDLERKSGLSPMAVHADRGWLWAKFLAKWIRDNVTEERR